MSSARKRVTVAAAPVADRPLVGILLMVGFCLLAPMGDAVAKLLGGLPLGQLLLVRYAFQALLLVPLVYATGKSLTLTPRVLRLTVLRTLLHVTSLGVFFIALRYLPMADAVAICFVMPFILLLLGRFVLGEEVGPHRLAACAAGFVGTLLVVQPSFLEVGTPALLPLAVALLFSVFMLVTRQIARDADPLVLQAVSGVVATLALAPLVLLATGRGWAEFDPVSVSPAEAGLLLLLGFFGTAAHLLMTWSLRFAPSATLAPIQYLELPFAVLVGFLIFGDLPDGLATLGIAVTIASGLYILYRERRISARVEPPAPPAP